MHLPSFAVSPRQDRADPHAPTPPPVPCRPADRRSHSSRFPLSSWAPERTERGRNVREASSFRSRDFRYKKIGSRRTAPEHTIQ